jgi:hypothetical protein
VFHSYTDENQTEDIFCGLYTYSNDAKELQSVTIHDEFHGRGFHGQGCYHVGKLYTTGYCIEHARE